MAKANVAAETLLSTSDAQSGGNVTRKWDMMCVEVLV